MTTAQTRDPRHAGPPCPHCAKPLASAAAWEELKGGEGGYLCWAPRGIDCMNPAFDWLGKCADLTRQVEALRAESERLRRRAGAFDHVRDLVAEFGDVDDGRAAMTCIGEFIGEWEHGSRDSRTEVRAERDRLVAVLEESKEAVGELAEVLTSRNGSLGRQMARAALAHLRNRARVPAERCREGGAVMGLQHALIDAYWIFCDRCGAMADDQNHERRGLATTAAEDAGWVERSGKWLCPKCQPKGEP